MSLNGRKIAIVGGGSGIGYAVAEACIAERALVTIASSNLDRVKASAGKLGNAARAERVDVKDEGSVEAFFAATGPLDHIVTTAGDWGGPRRGAGLADLDLQAARSIFDVRFWGALALASVQASRRQAASDFVARVADMGINLRLSSSQIMASIARVAHPVYIGFA